MSKLFTNFGDSTEDRKRSAELHEFWARNLAALPEALEYRQFKNSLPLEQAYALQFAAQDERLVGDFGRTEQLLDEADALFHTAEESDHQENRNEVRDLGIGLRMQRAWLSGAKENGTPQHRHLIRDLWRDLESGCQHNSNILGSLLDIEDKEKVLDDLWAPAPNTGVNADPDNPALSLPGEWFQGPHPLTVHNRFEYRFRQLLRMGSQRLNPTRDELALDAQRGWMGQEHFGETVLTFAELDLKRGYSTTCRRMLVTLLEAVARAFHEGRNGQKEMATYRLLMRYEPESDSYRTSYVDVLIAQKELLERELRVLGFEKMDWLGVAERLDHYFSILVDEDLLTTKAAEQIRDSGKTGEEFNTRQKQLRDALEMAKAHWGHGARQECLADLEKVLNFSRQSRVVLPQLEALDFWLRCAHSVNEPLLGKVSDRATLLRSLTLQYIGQFGKTIQEPRAQQLANQLLEVLQSTPVGRAA